MTTPTTSGTGSAASPTARGMVTAPTGATLAELQEQQWERTGGASRLHADGAWHTGAELATRARRLAAGLRAAGVGAGERVVVCMANSADVGVLYAAVWRAGAVATPVLFLLTEAELRHVLVDSRATLAVTTAEFLPKVSAAAEGTGVRLVLAGPGDLPAGGLRLAELEQAGEEHLVPRSPADLAALLYTGGTTGRSKGVMLSHDAISSAAWAAIAAYRSTDGTVPLVSLACLPLSHVYGLSVSAMALHVAEPTTSVLMRWFDPAGWLDLVEEHRAENAALVPSMLQMLLGQPLEDRDLGSLRSVSSGGAPLAPALAEELQRRVPTLQVLQGYGCTESAAIISTSPPGRGRPGTVGLPAPLVEVRLESAAGEPVGDGGDGEICVRGPMVMSGYWESPEETSFALRGGWLHTGDVGRLDPDGHLVVVDRLKDLVIRGGINVYPADVEAALVEHPDVVGAGVVGRPDERLGEEVVAFVVPRPGSGLTVEDVVAFARERVSSAKYPREVHLVDALPLTSVLKLDRKALRARLAAGA